MRMALRPAGGGTEASILTEMQMSGKAAAMGQGVIKDVAATLTDTFAQNVAKLVEAPAAEPASAPPVMEEPPSLDAGKIAASVASQRARDPRTVAALVFLILLVLVVLGRRRR